MPEIGKGGCHLLLINWSHRTNKRRVSMSGHPCLPQCFLHVLGTFRSACFNRKVEL